MILIAESGSTKTNWCLIKADKHKTYFDTEGYNPYFVSSDAIEQSLKKHIPAAIGVEMIDEIHFYGAGCFPEKKYVVGNALKEIFPLTKILIEVDLLAAARAMLGKKAGFAAILGTGTNTGLYDGQHITGNVDSLGYILGDEGSGCAIGKKLLGDYVRGYMPPDLREIFWQEYKLTPADIMNEIYSKQLANRFCAGFSTFVHKNIDNRYLHDLVQKTFYDLFQNLVSHYPEYKQYTFNCVGSVAYSYKKILTGVVEQFDMKPGKFLRAPIEELVKYHEDLSFNYV